MLTIIVPMLNEAAEMPQLCGQLAFYANRGCEVVLVDGGSDDGSPAAARAAGFTVIDGPRGRARQMNAGAAQAHGDILLFLHADTSLPRDADMAIELAVADGREWGRFDIRISGRPRLLRLVACMMNWRSRLTGIATGDQAIWVNRTLFGEIGGFADQPLMEDIELCAQLRRKSRPACLNLRVITSGRRWEERGVLRTIVLMWRLRLAYWRGVPADRLARAYR